MAILAITTIVLGIFAIELAVLLLGRRRFAASAPPSRGAPHDGPENLRRRQADRFATRTRRSTWASSGLR
jgi:hypothetical protein